MKSLSKLLLVFLLGKILISCSSPSDSNKDELGPGEFISQTTGVIEDNFSGKATFILKTQGLDEKQYLQLDLEAGKIPFVSETYGIFLTVPWHTNGTLTLDNSDIASLYVSPNSFFPFFPYILSSGSIIINSQSADLITGEINLSDSLTTPDSGSIEITGAFKAIRSVRLPN